MITGSRSSQSVGELPLWAKQRDEAIASATSRAERADVEFISKAREFVIRYLAHCIDGQASSEEITDACKRSGIKPPDDRAFGVIYKNLSRDGLIIKSGFCLRKKGHGTSGGNIWRLR